MKLVNRVSVFFLAALAVALIGYSTVIYYVISSYLYRQFDADLHGALDLLAASVEVEPDDAKWHPAEHGIDLSQPVFDVVSWVVCNEAGQVVDRSPRLNRQDPTDKILFDYATQNHSHQRAAQLGDWRLLQRALAAPAPKDIRLREPHEYASVRITVGRPLAELQKPLRRLGVLVSALPIIVWLIAAGMGRWFVGHALLPVREMAARARSTGQADFSLRLPSNTSGDELSDLSTAFNQLLDHLQTAFNRQKRFTSDAAHQLRTPLAVLLGQIDVARRRPRTPEEYQQTLDLLSRQTVELTQVVESLLYLAQSEEGAVTANMESLELDNWLMSHLDSWDDHPRGTDLTVDLQSRAVVTVVPSLLGQLLDNLLNNAFAYSSPGTPVTLTTRSHGEEVELAVRDEGVGISPQDQEAIFDPFFRSAQARQAGTVGTGLGLSIVNRISQALGGRITCRSTPGKGSEFSLILPASKVVEKSEAKTGIQAANSPS